MATTNAQSTSQTVIATATKCHLIPASELAPGESSTIRNSLVKKIVATAAIELKIAESSLIVRDIRPKDDLGYTYQTSSVVTGATPNDYETLISGVNATDRWIGIFGLKTNRNPPVTALKFNVGGGDRVIWVLECLKPEDDMVGFSPAGVMIPPSQPFVISQYVITPNATANIVLKGFVVESRGKVISP
jgi:hypothetical protein